MAKPSSSLRARLGSSLGLLVVALIVVGIFVTRGQRDEAKVVPYSELVAAIDEGRAKEVSFEASEIHAKLAGKDGKGDETIVAVRIPEMDERPLLDALLKARGVAVTGKHEERGFLTTALLGMLPFIVIPLLFLGLSTFAARGQGKAMTFGKSRAKIYDQSPENVTRFSDVAGIDEAKAELTEVVKFLKEPAKYRAVGARVPKGVLLVGAPGTGKTLLAKAVAGESGVPFFSMSGSEFVEMFVGVGASRVRDLFEQAKSHAPCIVFIDELDAIGKARSGAQGFAANEEREQTLNQLLVEMDGFDSGSGLVMMAATNRPEILDRALSRAGRFDRQVLVDRPDVRGREAILKVHAKKVQLGVDVDLTHVAQRTPGMVGADLANVVNEAALASVRRDATIVEAQDFEEAIDRLQLGLKKGGRVMTDDEKRRVAFHESGHALVALSMKHADPVHRVTIIPRSIGALGATLQLPTEERYLVTREELLDRICTLLGGRAAEEVACEDVSTGAEDDLARATELSRLMVSRFGMSEALGPAATSRGADDSPAWMGRSDGPSEATRQLVDTEIRAILERELGRARAVLSRERAKLDAIAAALLVRETLQRKELEDLVAGAPPPTPTTT